jgi:hypothetical protein
MITRKAFTRVPCSKVLKTVPFLYKGSNKLILKCKLDSYLTMFQMPKKEIEIWGLVSEKSDNKDRQKETDAQD